MVGMREFGQIDSNLLCRIHFHLSLRKNSFLQCFEIDLKKIDFFLRFTAFVLKQSIKFFLIVLKVLKKK